jgi:signal transduction histidine kinase
MQRASGLPFVPWLARLGAYAVWLLVALPVVSAMAPGAQRAVAAILLSTSGVLLGFFLTRQRAVASVRTYLAVQTVLVLAVYAMRPDAALGVAQMFFLFTAQAVLFLPGREAALWVAAFTVITFLGGLHVIGRPGLPSVVATASGNAIFGGLAAALRQTQLANRRVRGLLGEVQEAHARLRELSEATERLAVAQERERIAREMHDALGHRLTVAVVQLEGARRLIPSDPDRAAHMIETMREQLKDGLGELRETVASLRSPVRATLETSLERLASAFESATGIEVLRDLARTLPELDGERMHALYRIAQEGLTNIQRHADASTAWLSIDVGPEALTLRIEDDGRGYPDQAAPGRFGLGGVAERVAALGGHMELGARAGGGARLEVRLPLDASAASAVAAEVGRA